MLFLHRNEPQSVIFNAIWMIDRYINKSTENLLTYLHQVFIKEQVVKIQSY